MSTLQTQQVIASLRYVRESIFSADEINIEVLFEQDKHDGSPSAEEIKAYEDNITGIMELFKAYKEFAPLTTAFSGIESTHSPFFNPLDSKTYQLSEFMKTTNGFDPLECMFYTEWVCKCR